MIVQAVRDEINKRMREREREITRLKQESLVDEISLLKTYFDEIFEQYPGLQLVSWSQYTEAEYDDEGGYSDYTRTSLQSIRVDGIAIDISGGEGNAPSGVHGIINTLDKFFDYHMYDFTLSEMFGPDTMVAATRHGIIPVEYGVDVMDLQPNFNATL